ncbi:MAG: nucleotidyltransferase domain-containing protein [Nevskiales bacterium]
MSTKKAAQPRTSPVRLLLGEYHIRLLSLLLLRPAEDFHIRQIERLAGVPAGPARRELQRFHEAGLVSRRRLGNQVRYRADRGCVVYEELAAMLRKTVGMADLLRDALVPLAHQIDAAFLFGSAAQGKEGPYSDVDLMIVGNAPFDTVVAAIQKPQEQLGRPVNPVILRSRDFKSKLKTGDGFVGRVMSEPRIMLLGNVNEPGKPA